jgi:hypothetical protein
MDEAIARSVALRLESSHGGRSDRQCDDCSVDLGTPPSTVGRAHQISVARLGHGGDGRSDERELGDRPRARPRYRRINPLGQVRAVQASWDEQPLPPPGEDVVAVPIDPRRVDVGIVHHLVTMLNQPVDETGSLFVGQKPVQ